MKIKILTWNISKASHTRENLWKYLTELDFDIGLFQEVYILPYKIRKNYYSVRGEMNAILLKKSIITNVEKENILDVPSGNDLIADLCISCEAKLLGNKLVILSIYNYPGPTVSDFAEFLEILYKYLRNNRDKIIIIGGDFCMNEKFQNQVKKWGLLAREIKEELSRLDYKEVVYERYGDSAFTFITTKNKKTYQIDYLFIPKEVSLVDVMIGNKDDIIGPNSRLSDHLPIIATIEC